MTKQLSQDYHPGPIVLFGSGETSPSGRKIFDAVMQKLPVQPKVALLETPAGFELNSTQVIGRVGDFLAHRLQNYEPQIEIIHARKRGTSQSPDDPEIARPLLEADMVFMGPGSPSYAVRQLMDSVTWQYLIARHRLGGALVLASAATVAISSYSLPVYEIYKVGEDIHWKRGLDFFGLYGMSLVFIPHWNNNDGGDELDTSRCFMGKPRFVHLIELLPPDLTIIGIDEKTGLYIDPESGICKVIGLGGVTLIHTGQVHEESIDERDLRESGLQVISQSRSSHVHRFKDGDSFQLNRIGSFNRPTSSEGLTPEVWRLALLAKQKAKEGSESDDHPPSEVMALIEARKTARIQKKWSEADRLRQAIEKVGWTVMDTPDGTEVIRK
jgi:cyanophycinase-like exopeptidase